MHPVRSISCLSVLRSQQKMILILFFLFHYLLFYFTPSFGFLVWNQISNKVNNLLWRYGFQLWWTHLSGILSVSRINFREPAQVFLFVYCVEPPTERILLHFNREYTLTGEYSFLKTKKSIKGYVCSCTGKNQLTINHQITR